MLFKPKKVFVEKAAADLSRTQRILQHFPGQDIVWIDDYRTVDFSFLPMHERFGEAKRHLAVGAKQGAMVKEFRRHHALRQEVEFYLMHSVNCPFDCAYCYLQCYFSHAAPTIFANRDDLFEQVKLIMHERPAKETLFHAGETADALALEQYSGFAVEAVEFFSRLDGALLELRTKSDLVEPLLPLEHRGRTVVSWTLSPGAIAERYENGAASIAARLNAARRCQAVGYPVGLRLDPIIRYDGWRHGYEKLIDAISAVLEPEGMESIVLGTFRCPPRLLDIMRERFDRNELVLGEFVPAPDGKMRYFRHIRQEMYREVVRMFQQRCGPAILSKIELAMEPDYVWRETGLTRP